MSAAGATASTAVGGRILPREDPPPDDAAACPACPPACPAVCPLCCEEDLSSPAAVVLSSCLHRSCRTCLTRWIEREEATGRRAPPTCPFCRAEIGDEEAFSILGRPFQPRPARGADVVGGDDEVDGLTLQWMNEHTVPCRACGSRVEKDGGCDLIECLCGYRFCYLCGAAGGECDCNPGHVFDNDRFQRNDTYIEAPVVRDGNGFVDMRSCIRRREVRRRREARGEQVRDEQAKRWEYAEDTADACVGSGRWLFVPASNAGCLTMLARQLEADEVRNGRGRRQFHRTLDEYLRWDANWNSVYVSSARTWPLSRKKREGCIMVRPELVDESWLFLPRGEDTAALGQRARGRKYRKNARARVVSGVRGAASAARRLKTHLLKSRGHKR